ncbi:hypothetical protein QCE81_35090 [Caballeronia sp. LZ002]|nr:MULTISPECIES: hypothetical protein [unclassified Caballeronia]MDR5777056.1 hypothetical protein [Caballeronia sp. LZ002]MDR5798609.1 hypothetical protein [Caballeronia sp. LZ001]MDR5852500.1 hypothetical protein [Caballeronia sp. LZ003]
MTISAERLNWTFALKNMAGCILRREREGNLAVERIEPNEAAIAAELLQVLAMRLCVTSKDGKTGKGDKRLSRGTLDGTMPLSLRQHKRNSDDARPANGTSGPCTRLPLRGGRWTSARPRRVLLVLAIDLLDEEAQLSKNISTSVSASAEANQQRSPTISRQWLSH